MRRIILFWITIFVASYITADNTRYIYGLIKDKVTQEILYDVHVTIYSDTTIIAEGLSSKDYNVGSGNGGYWFTNIPAEGGTFAFYFIRTGTRMPRRY